MKGFVIALGLVAACSGDIDSASTDASGSGGGGGGSGTNYMDAPAGTGEPANLMGTTDAHNAIRAMVDTTTPLPLMKWDPALATLATNWASQCIDTDGNGLVDHSSTQYRSNAAGYQYVGENIFASGGSATGPGAVMYWAQEKANFTYPNGCAGTCGHYTQIVWRTSVNVGCALVSCPSLTYKSVVLCNYGPGGNSGGAPY